MDKQWFEEQFNTSDNCDKWGHQFRATQQIRYQISYDLLNKYLTNKHNVVTDLCCGLGDFLVKFKGRTLRGYDISSNAVEKASKLYKGIVFEQNELPYIEKTSDVFIVLECLNYLDMKTTTSNIFSNLNSEGLVLISVSVDYEKELLDILRTKDIIEKKYTYFGLFSKIESKLVFYSKDIEYIVNRKKARNKYLLSKLLKSRFSCITERIMGIIRTLSLLILKSHFFVKLFSIVPLKRHVILLVKNEK